MQTPARSGFQRRSLSLSLSLSLCALSIPWLGLVEADATRVELSYRPDERDVTVEYDERTSDPVVVAEDVLPAPILGEDWDGRSDGRDDDGHGAASGTDLARLPLGDRVLSRKIVWIQ